MTRCDSLLNFVLWICDKLPAHDSLKYVKLVVIENEKIIYAFWIATLKMENIKGVDIHS